MKDILNEIIEHKRIEIEAQKKTISAENLQANFQDRDWNHRRVQTEIALKRMD